MARLDRKYRWLVAGLGVLVCARAYCDNAPEQQGPPQESWIDRSHSFVYDTLWRTAMGLDRYFGAHQEDPNVYQKLYGSVAPALLWDQLRGVQPKLRFQVNAPLPQLNDRFSAVIGRLNPDEFVTESAEQSGAIQRQFGPEATDESIFGLAYRGPLKTGGSFGYGAGVRLRFPLDPYIKGDYSFVRGTPTAVLMTLKETLFWEQSEHLGVTSRLDLDHFLSDKMLLRFSTADTLSQKSQGVRGFASMTLLRSLATRRAVVWNLSTDWETGAPVPLHEFGGAVAYRQSVFREWLILELRSSVTWPKLLPDTGRRADFGVGVAFEMLFGTTQFRARPVTF